MDRFKPFLKWAGGKYRCLHHVIPSLPKGGRLIEPFTGSGAVFLNAPHQNFLLAEANPDLVSLYQHLQREGLPFIQYCKSFFSKKNNCAEVYYAYRLEFNQTKLGARRRAALFLYLNRHGYNGLCRYNLSGQYNVPFGRYIKPYFPEHELAHFYQKSQSAHFIKADFRKTFLEAKPGDVIYCDPPYVPLSHSSQFTAYTRQKFNAAAQKDLATLAKASAKKGVPVVISNHDTPFTREIYQGGKLHSFPVQRNISCKGSQRHAVHELIAVFK